MRESIVSLAEVLTEQKYRELTDEELLSVLRNEIPCIDYDTLRGYNGKEKVAVLREYYKYRSFNLF